jgi:hypothetical protein
MVLSEARGRVEEASRNCHDVEERSGHPVVAEHYNALAEAAERSVKATLEERFPRMRTA